MRLIALGVLVGLWSLSGTPAVAADKSRSPLEKSFHHAGSDLVLRSVSLKEATVLRVNVYWVGLYSETASTPPDSIFYSDQIRAFVFHFVRDIKSNKLQEAWIQDLTKSCVIGCAPVLAQGRVLAGTMPDIQSSQKIAYVLFPDRVDVLVAGRVLGSLTGVDSVQAILATFLGPKAPMSLRRDLIAPLMPPASGG